MRTLAWAFFFYLPRPEEKDITTLDGGSFTQKKKQEEFSQDGLINAGE